MIYLAILFFTLYGMYKLRKAYFEFQDIREAQAAHKSSDIITNNDEHCKQFERVG